MLRDPTSNERLQALSSHLAAPQFAMASKDPITCHVLDTTTGRPAAGIIATLSCRSFPHSAFVATTNSDGRITNWEPETANQPAIETEIREQAEQEGNSIVPKGSSMWKLTFNTGAYYGAGKTFFPLVDLTFLAKEGEHFHVPLLLGPYSYTTYRGS
jgi:5-hydroxyisourate hydrolase